jgi:hypothetical protein
VGLDSEECPWFRTPFMPRPWLFIMSFRRRGVVGIHRPRDWRGRSVGVPLVVPLVGVPF